MFIDLLIRLVDILYNLFVLLVFLQAILSYFLDTYHPLRQFLYRIVGPLLNPIRRVVPTVGMFDISPLILVFLLWALRGALLNLLFALR